MQLKKIALAACSALSLVASGSAMADQFPDFVINASAFGGPASLTADRIPGIYEEEIQFVPSNPANPAAGGQFFVSLKFEAGTFVLNGNTIGATPVPANPSIAWSGLNANYGLYALFLGAGSYTVNGSGAPAFTLNPASSQMQVWIDRNRDSIGSPTWNVANAQSFWTQSPASQADDVQIAVGVALNGQGAVTCTTAGNSCGSFLQNTSFVPVGAGVSFFAGPSPFYSISLQSGDLNGIDPATTTRVRGEMDVVFQVGQQVPEPASLALVGLALAGVAAARRRKA